MNNKMIFQRIHGKNGERLGIVLAYIGDDNLIRLGWSKRNVKRDAYNKELEMRIALGRANTQWIDYPHSFKNAIYNMKDRSERYFKQRAGFFNFST